MITILFLFIINIFVFYTVLHKPGFALAFIFLFASINNILFYSLNYGIIRYLFPVLILFLYIIRNIKIKIIYYNLQLAFSNRIFIGVLLLLLGMLLSSLNNEISLKGYSTINKFMFPIIFLFFAAVTMIKSIKDLEQISVGIIIFGAIFFIVFYLFMDIGNIDIGNRLTISETELFNAITLGRICGMIFIPAILSTFYVENRFFKLFSLLISLISLYWLFVTSQRGIILAVTLVIALYFLMSLKLKSRSNFWIYVIFTVVFIIIYLGFVNFEQFGFINRFEQLANYRDMPRYWDYFKAWNIFTDHFILGVGTAGYSALTGRSYPHNLFLEMMSEYGIFGITSFLLIVSTGLHFTIKIIRSENISYKVKSLSLIWLFYTISSLTSGNLTVNRDFWIMSGLMISLIRCIKPYIFVGSKKQQGNLAMLQSNY